ncbi:MAG TPA: DUF6307 family protein [Mycobacterium sp.]
MFGYGIRSRLLHETLQLYSPLEDAAHHDLAVQVLHALNSIPEKIRRAANYCHASSGSLRTAPTRHRNPCGKAVVGAS